MDYVLSCHTIIHNPYKLKLYIPVCNMHVTVNFDNWEMCQWPN